MNIDPTDRKILRHLQKDSSGSLDDLSAKVNLSRNACWRRIKALEEGNIIKRRVALCDADALDLKLTVFLSVRTNQHDLNWLETFAKELRIMPEIMDIFRMSGDLDYLVRAVVADMADYDRLYKRIISKVPLSDVSASFVMEEIKATTELPI